MRKAIFFSPLKLDTFKEIRTGILRLNQKSHMKTLILCNGKPPNRKLFHSCRQWADYFIAADGGGNIAREFGSLPDLVIGDLDSFQKHESRYDPNHQ